VLFLVANTANTKSRLRLDEEGREVAEIIRNGPARDLELVAKLKGATEETE
jgi:hypothetical protein